MHLTIHGQLPSLNEANNAARTHWTKAARMKKEATELVALQCTRMPKITKPVMLTFHWFYSSKHDFDNIRSACKFVLDGMVQAGKLPDDNQKWVVGFNGDYFIKVPKGQEKVVIDIEEYDS